MLNQVGTQLMRFSTLHSWNELSAAEAKSAQASRGQEVSRGRFLIRVHNQCSAFHNQRHWKNLNSVELVGPYQYLVLALLT